jgi:hypothetical protein
VENAPKADTLPLLAFALQRLWRQFAAKRILLREHLDRMRPSGRCAALRPTPLVSVSKLLESAESFGFKGGGLIRPGAVDVDA